MWVWDRRTLSARVEQALAVGHGDLAPASRQLANPAAGASLPLERRLGERTSQPLLPLGELPQGPGFVAAAGGGRDYLVARRDNGELALYANRCRHRGAALRCERGAPRAVCPYHGWNYGVDGRLRGAYGRQHGVEEALALSSLPLQSGGGFIWRQGEELALDGAMLDGVQIFHRWQAPRVLRQFELPGDFHWTIGVEAFLETYHFAAAHQATLGSLPVKNTALCDPDGDAVRFTVPWRLPQEVGEDVRAYCHFMYYFFPNTFFLVFEDHFGWLTIEQTGATTSRLIYRGLSPVAAPSTELTAKIEASVGFLEGVKREDVALCEAVQRNLALGAVDVVTRYEPGVQWFRLRLAALHQH